MCKTIVFILLALSSFSADGFADTFTHKRSGEVLHGYATQKKMRDKTVVRTVEKGIQHLALSEYKVSYDSHGRENKVTVLAVRKPIQLQVEAEAIEKAIINASNKGTLFILLELDSAGGNPSIIKRICACITGTENCPIYAFINGGQANGVYAASAMLALACDRIYMAPHSNIGAAKVQQDDDKKANLDLKKRFGESIGEKFTSAYRAYAAALAEQNDRPGLVAMAIVDKDIEVIEVAQAAPAKAKTPAAKRFIEPINRKADQTVIRTWSRKGRPLTLSAQQAVQCKMADKIVASQAELLEMLGAEDAQLVYEDSHIKARQEFAEIEKRFKKLIKDIKELEKAKASIRDRRQRLRTLSRLIDSYEQAIDLAEHNTDLHFNVSPMRWNLNTAKGQYQRIRAAR